MLKLKLANPSEYTNNTVGLFIKEQCEAGSDVILEFKYVKAHVGQRNSRFVLDFFKGGKHIKHLKVDCYKDIGPVFMSALRDHYKYLKVHRNFPWGDVTIVILDDAEDYI